MVSPEDTHGRRRFLQAAGAALSATAASAGCLSTLPPIGQRIRYGRVDVPPAEPPTYREWIPATSALQPYFTEREREDDDNEMPTVMFALPGRLGGETLGTGMTFPRSVHQSFFDYVGIDYETLDRAFHFHDTFVGQGDVDRTVVERTLEATRYERTGSHDGYDLYTRSDIPRALAVGDDALLNTVVDEQAFRDAETSGVDAAVGRLQTTIDAKAGRVQRQHEVDDDFALLTDITGAQNFSWVGSARRGTDAVTGSTTFTFDSEHVYYSWFDVYESPDTTPTASEIRHSLESEDRAIDATMTDLQTNGRYVSIENVMDVETYRQRLDDSEGHFEGHTTFGVDWDPERKRLTFHYEAGDTAIDTDRLHVHPEYGFEGSDPFDGLGDSFEPGDSITLQLVEGHADYYRIDWEAAGGHSSAYLFNYSLPEEASG